MSVAVSIIIVSYNSGAVLPACLSSLASREPGILPGDIEVLVVDNASPYRSAEQIATHFPWVRLIRSEQNVGFGRANNLGASLASGRHLFFLNPDTELRTSAATELLEFMEKPEHSHIGIAGPCVEDEFGAQGTVGGNFPTLMSLLRELIPAGISSYRLQIRATHDDYQLIDYVTGAGMFIRRELFQRAGGFDPGFFLYFEETELQYRLARMGYARAVHNRARIMHRCATRDYKDTIERIRFFESSRILYYRKTMGRMATLMAKGLLVLYYLSRGMAKRRGRYLSAAALVMTL